MTASDTRTTTQFFEVAIKMHPWGSSATPLGLYSTPELAMRIANFIRDTFTGEFNGGITVSVERRLTKNEIKQLDKKMQFTDALPGRTTAIHTISKELDREEIARIVNLIPSLKETNQQSEPASLPRPTDLSDSLQKSDCYVLYELSGNPNQKPLGIYSSKKALDSVINFCTLMQINYDYQMERRDVVVLKSGKKAAFVQNSSPEHPGDQTWMRVADRLDSLEAKRITQSLGCKEPK